MTALADGKSSLTIRCNSDRLVVPVTVTAALEEPKLSFVKDVVPIFTMAGCAGSNCHGSIRGQNGFKLSLFGYEPDLDYQAIQARIDREHPEQSLLLRKPTFQMPHGGGVRFTTASLEYRSILEWIDGGATYDSAGSPRIASLTVFPRERTLAGVGATQQLVATAKYTDGTTRDVTHLVQYTSNNPDIVQVSADGKIKAVEAGETAIMVRTLGQAVAAKIYVPLPAPAKTFRTRSAEQLHRRIRFRQAGSPAHRAFGSRRRRTLSAPRLPGHDRRASDAAGGGGVPEIARGR